MDEQQFEAIVLQTFGEAVDDYFYSKIVGGEYQNADGIYRSRLLSECEPFDLLDLVPEPDNAFDAHAVKVIRRGTEGLLGYLPSRTAADLMRRIEPGIMWIAVFKEHNVHPRTNRILGANVMVLRWNEARRQEAEEMRRPKTKEERWEAVRKERAARLGDT
jgi:hypothetical protein